MRPGSMGWMGQEGRLGGANYVNESRKDAVSAGTCQVHLLPSFISDSEMLQKPQAGSGNLD